MLLRARGQRLSPEEREKRVVEAPARAKEIKRKQGLWEARIKADNYYRCLKRLKAQPHREAGREELLALGNKYGNNILIEVLNTEGYR